MASRIRYEKTDDNHILKSVRTLISESTDAMYEVFLNTKSCTYIIKNLTRRRTFEGGKDINNLHVLKRKVKERLESLGVDFSRETRDNSTRVVGINCGYRKD